MQQLANDRNRMAGLEGLTKTLKDEAIREQIREKAVAYLLDDYGAIPDSVIEGATEALIADIRKDYGDMPEAVREALMEDEEIRAAVREDEDLHDQVKDEIEEGIRERHSAADRLEGAWRVLSPT